MENKNEIFPVTFDGGWGGGGIGRVTKSKTISGFEHTQISESAQWNRIYSKPLSRVM